MRSSPYKGVIAFFVLLLVLFIRPRGLLGEPGLGEFITNEDVLGGAHPTWLRGVLESIYERLPNPP